MTTQQSQQIEVADEALETQQKVLLFLLGQETFGLPIMHIREIIEYEGVSRVPMMPSHVRGVINLRGNVVPIVDLSARLGRQPLHSSRRTCVVVLELRYEDEQVELGVMVDAVSEVIDIGSRDIQSAPGFGAGVREEFIAGMGRIAERFVVLLEQATTFNLHELAALQRGSHAVSELAR